MKSVADFKARYAEEGGPLRLGQAFVCWYIKNPWPELFYETNDGVSMLIIINWLTKNQYHDNLPQEVCNA